MQKICINLVLPQLFQSFVSAAMSQTHNINVNVDEWELWVHVNALSTSIQPFLCSLLMTSGKISSPPQSQKANNSGTISLAPSLRMAHRPGLRKAPKLWTVWSSKYELCVQSPHQAALAGYKGRVLAPKLHNTWIWADTGWARVVQ